jgi:hypothetical protein
MATEPYTMRLLPDEQIEITMVKRPRETARNLQARVSRGSYGDAELQEFWLLAENAGLVLHASNPQLGARAGLGDQFFSSVVRDKRRPKLTNFLKALAAIVDTADELLFDIEKHGGTFTGASTEQAEISRRVKQDRSELLLMATALGQMARKEIDKLEYERPNDPEIIESYNRQRELLLIFATGFEKIATTLVDLEKNEREPALLGKAREAVASVGNQVNEWLRKNAAEAVDWSVRLPVFAAGVALLGWAGANMTIATSAVAAIVGGTKVVGILRKGRRA